MMEFVKKIIVVIYQINYNVVVQLFIHKLNVIFKNIIYIKKIQYVHHKFVNYMEIQIYVMVMNLMVILVYQLIINVNHVNKLQMHVYVLKHQEFVFGMIIYANHFYVINLKQKVHVRLFHVVNGMNKIINAYFIVIKLFLQMIVIKELMIVIMMKILIFVNQVFIRFQV